MKRLVLLLLALLLMADLADDSCLGKVKLVSPASPVKSLEVSAKHYGSEAPDCRNEIRQANLQPLFSQCPSQGTIPIDQQSRKIIFTSNLSSAGGLAG
jgi:hypothetical protein